MPRNRISIQLYTVRDMLAADPAGTLQQIAAIGYHNVEAAGLAGLTAAQFRALTDANGLKIVGAHLSIVDLRNDLDATLDTAETLGLEWVGVGPLSYPFVFNPPRPFAPTTEAAYRALAEQANRYGATPNFGSGITDPGTGAIDFRAIFESLERPKQKEYIIERDTQVHPMLTARIGWDFLRSLRGTPHGGSRRGGRAA